LHHDIHNIFRTVSIFYRDRHTGPCHERPSAERLTRRICSVGVAEIHRECAHDVIHFGLQFVTLDDVEQRTDQITDCTADWPRDELREERPCESGKRLANRVRTAGDGSGKRVDRTGDDVLTPVVFFLFLLLLFLLLFVYELLP
jgi:hypothetical protein